ncbi:hypothetical protein EBB59_02395 [Lysobacter pythonis]|uniref:Phytase-like domain-containing protein n=1 Tax=Solilutibacter pythonis TaxID=2483112 RepID=A0A3M2I3I6_9GAMM|nr:hypothetical protein [Lysobacter pythonis]RMH94540.1 hypothetical protein EBB59_02395 [Lysobacter pythonis]
MRPPVPRFAGFAIACALTFALTACADGGGADMPTPQIAGLITDGALDEISGIAASRRHDGVLWAIDDSGNPARLYAIGRRGGRLGTYQVEGVEKTDWEDIAAFELNGKPYLLVADTGDNGGIRKLLQLHVFEEPEDAEADGTLRPAWSLQFRWPDGARDCEAVAVDAERNQIILISKKRQPPQVFTLPLQPRAGGKGPKTETAALAGTLAGAPQADARERRDNPTMARLRSQVTAADIAPHRDAIAVLTYDNLLIYRRKPAQTWPQALASAPQVVRLRFLPQAEAVAWSRGGGGIYATGEFNPAPIMYLPWAR